MTPSVTEAPETVTQSTEREETTVVVEEEKSDGGSDVVAERAWKYVCQVCYRVFGTEESCNKHTTICSRKARIAQATQQSVAQSYKGKFVCRKGCSRPFNHASNRRRHEKLCFGGPISIKAERSPIANRVPAPSLDTEADSAAGPSYTSTDIEARPTLKSGYSIQCRKGCRKKFTWLSTRNRHEKKSCPYRYISREMSR